MSEDSLGYTAHGEPLEPCFDKLRTSGIYGFCYALGIRAKGIDRSLGGTQGMFLQQREVRAMARTSRLPIPNRSSVWQEQGLLLGCLLVGTYAPRQMDAAIGEGSTRDTHVGRMLHLPFPSTSLYLLYAVDVQPEAGAPTADIAAARGYGIT